ncbi:small integral membrane protein 26-like [Sapajus apella]|uniref:Small integral membrane protein 26-like n=1 Tax=Sapajus apella TaxID=9515 RepID=A0A6J3J272_SAPAP|nr:small integral membrane protein 26-like [Sapajus apella]
MYQNQLMAWNQQMLVVYGISTWSPVGSMLYVRWKMAHPSGDEVQQKVDSTSEVPSELSEPPKGFYVETIVTYKEDFVPITEKILNYWKSWTSAPVQNHDWLLNSENQDVVQHLNLIDALIPILCL